MRVCWAGRAVSSARGPSVWVQWSMGVRGSGWCWHSSWLLVLDDVCVRTIVVRPGRESRGGVRKRYNQAYMPVVGGSRSLLILVVLWLRSPIREGFGSVCIALLWRVVLAHLAGLKPMTHIGEESPP
jgi:hypothetical protein